MLWIKQDGSILKLFLYFVFLLLLTYLRHFLYAPYINTGEGGGGGSVEHQPAASTSGVQSDSQSDDEPMIDPDRYSPFFYLWILCSIASSLYAYTWDIKMDWGLLDRLVKIVYACEILFIPFPRALTRVQFFKQFEKHSFSLIGTLAKTSFCGKKLFTRPKVTIILRSQKTLY